MRKMILLAAMMAIAALMLAATPAMADDLDSDGFDDLTFLFVGHDDYCDYFDCRDEDDYCDFFDCRDEDDYCDFFDCRDNRDNDVVPAFEITQDFDQEAESGDVDQDFYVSNTGDNSNQSVNIQGVANTGNAQNQIGVIDAGGFGDLDSNDYNNGDDFCEDIYGNNFCEDLEDFCEDYDRDGFCDFFFDDFDRFDHEDDERFFFDNNDGSDFEFEDVGSTIEVSPTNTFNSDQQVNQAATAFGK
jgi:hypothetical protein